MPSHLPEMVSFPTITRPGTDLRKSDTFIPVYPDSANWIDHRQLRDHPPRRDTLLTRGRSAAKFIYRSPDLIFQKVAKKQKNTAPSGRIQKRSSEPRPFIHWIPVTAVETHMPLPAVSRSTDYHDTLAKYAIEQLTSAAADQHESAWFDPGLRTAWFDDDIFDDASNESAEQAGPDAVEQRAASLARLEGRSEENGGCLMVGSERVLQLPQQPHNESLTLDETPAARNFSMPGKPGAHQRATWHASATHVFPHQPSLLPAAGHVATTRTPANERVTTRGSTFRPGHLSDIARTSPSHPQIHPDKKRIRKSAPSPTSQLEAYRQALTSTGSVPTVPAISAAFSHEHITPPHHRHSFSTTKISTGRAAPPRLNGTTPNFSRLMLNYGLDEHAMIDPHNLHNDLRVLRKSELQAVGTSSENQSGCVGRLRERMRR